MGQLRAGVSEIELRPDLGLATGDTTIHAKGFQTPLYAKALVLTNGCEQVAVVTLDLLGIDRPDAARAAEMVSQRCGIPADGIIITCAHTMAGPSMVSSRHTYREAFHPEFDAGAKAREREWVDTVVETIVDAVCDAKARLKEASVGVVRADLPWLTFNRRRLTRNYGAYTYWLKVPQNQAYGAEGPVDTELGLFAVRGQDHRPLCLLWNFSGHNSFSFGDQYAADLPYTVQHALDERMGEHVPCLYAPGCSADINYHDYNRPGGLEKATDGIASAIMATYREACTLPEVKLGCRKVELYLAQRDFSRYWWKHDVGTKRPGWVEYVEKERQQLQSEAEEEPTYRADVMAMRLGEAALIGLPGEIFCEFGRMIKERSPFRHTYVASYANGFLGDVIPRHAWFGGSVEAWPVLNARAGREAGYLMVDKAVELLEELYAG